VTKTADKTFRHRSGAVYILAILILCVFAAMSVAFVATTDTALAKGNNNRLSLEARFAAESGINYLSHLLADASMSGSTLEELLSSLATILSDELDGTGNLATGETVSYDGTTISIPQIQVSAKQSCTAQIAVVSGSVIRLDVTGTIPVGGDGGSLTVSRSIGIEFEPYTPSAFDYGIYSKGPVDIGSGLNFVGANQPEEASVYSEAEGKAIEIDGGYIDGYVRTLHADAEVDIGATVNKDIELGADPVAVPVIDTSAFIPFATNIVDSSTNTSDGGTFNNIRIEAGTNPSFDKAVTLNGVVYVEAPNKVSFKNNVTFTGVLITEDPGPGVSAADHYIDFKNNLTVRGVEDLPDSPEFSELRQMPGTAFVAPGFTLEFKNNFSTINGIVAAESIIVKNNLDGLVYGSILILGDQGVEFKNNAHVTIDRSKYGGDSWGFELTGPRKLAAKASSYVEVASL